MTGRQLLLNPVLPFQHPVHRLVHVVFGGVRDAEQLGQRGPAPPPRGGQLGLGIQDTRRHQSRDPVAFGRGPGTDEPVEIEPFHRLPHGLDVAMRGGAVRYHFEDIFNPNQCFALEHAPNQFNPIHGQAR